MSQVIFYYIYCVSSHVMENNNQGRDEKHTLAAAPVDLAIAGCH